MANGIMRRRHEAKAKKPLEFHRCKNCGVSFRSSREFEAHACVADLNDVPLDELMRRYEQERGSK